MDPAVEAYFDGTNEEQRTALLVIHDLVTRLYPEAEVLLNYGVPTYRIGKRRFHIGIWKGGVSVYPGPEVVDEYRKSHPEARTSKGTVNFGLDLPLPLDEIEAMARRALG